MAPIVPTTLHNHSQIKLGSNHEQNRERLKVKRRLARHGLVQPGFHSVRLGAPQ